MPWLPLPFYGWAVTESCCVPNRVPPRSAVTLTCHVPGDGSLICPWYAPPPLEVSGASARTAAIPIAGIAGMKKTTRTEASEIGFPAASVNVTKRVLPLARTGVGSVRN